MVVSYIEVAEEALGDEVIVALEDKSVLFGQAGLERRQLVEWSRSLVAAVPRWRAADARSNAGPALADPASALPRRLDEREFDEQLSLLQRTRRLRSGGW